MLNLCTSRPPCAGDEAQAFGGVCTTNQRRATGFTPTLPLESTQVYDVRGHVASIAGSNLQDQHVEEWRRKQYAARPIVSLLLE